MDTNYINKIQKWFDKYVSNYNFLNKEHQKNIDLKYYHSLRVYHLIIELTNSINLEQNEKNLAGIIGLLHDIGRFEQYSCYRTFSDAKSVDHAQLGINILKENKLLEYITKAEKELIIKSIFYHNKAVLPTVETEKCILFCRLIRDADKLDIWRVVLNNYEGSENNKVIGLGLSSDATITPNIYNSIIKKETINYKELNTLDDLKLTQMGWIFDINFKKSFEIIKERNYLERIYKTISKSNKAKNAYQIINNYLDTNLDTKNI